MNRSNKKGFTIVELVIVIAVIAILAAVLIPTIAGLVKKANVSKDTQLVKNLNTAIAADTENDKTMAGALTSAAKFGYDIAKINASATDNEILWDSVNNVFCYLKDNAIEYIPEFPGAKNVENDADYWVIDDEINTSYSTYYYGTGDIDSETSTSICLTTNGTDLVVKAPNANVYHYGDVANLTIEAVANASYHEFGRVTQLAIVKKGHVKVENGGSIGTLVVESTDVKLTGDFGLVMGTSSVLNSITLPQGATKQEISADANLEGKVAIVGGALYADFADALAVAADNGTVVLVRDVKFAANKLFTINAGETVTLDLNGHAIMATAAEGTSSAVITNNGTLTIKDSVGGGLITTNALNPDMQPTPGFASNTITNNGTLTLEGGTIENTSPMGSKCACAVDNTESGKFYMKGGTLISYNSYAIRHYNNDSSGENVVEITGGRIERKNKDIVIWLQDGNVGMGGTLSITGGYIDGTILFGWYGHSSDYNITIKNCTVDTIWIYENCSIPSENIKISNVTYISGGLKDDRK